ncbi:hypothetical protein [Pseudobacteroides cellulosolvens]|uniref:Cyclic lactone autoinducer peptide n=1 Tax=Pseudobacteroides cellulosolvens ATCC 35603 = DSM 2933 TaxID=398512 RepID=A0A0L6JSY5_9FIRM|nr:hypothetical protein [Pseudobacteroides cellulosolvens]KNY28928.1 hypothetical protein Bccel_4202 [Pseudobacteroides cellulosolvens ATCC 35603 = DSM 2933]
MRNMKEQIVSMREKIGSKILGEIGNATVKIGEQSRGFCILLFSYEPKVPKELLYEKIED